MLKIHIVSFSYKNGIPVDGSGHGGGFVFDCRGLPNPGRLDFYKNLTGKDKEVAAYLDNEIVTHRFLLAVTEAVSVSIDSFIERGFDYLSINFGCTGGQHRSVYCAIKVTETLRQKYPMAQFKLEHREIDI